MAKTVCFTIGGLSLPGHVALTLGPRHPTSVGLIQLDTLVNDDLIASAGVGIGFGHRGAEKLFEVRDYRSMIMLADRHDWLSAFSGELSITLALEGAMGLIPPTRATILRTLLAELARVHSHLSYLSYVASSEHESILWSLIDQLREAVARWAGNRVHPMLNRVGGLAVDAPDNWFTELSETLDAVLKLLAGLRDDLSARTQLHNLATLTDQFCIDYGLSGPVSRAAGLDLDVRSSGYLAYDQLFEPIAQRCEADTFTRLDILIDEVHSSIAMMRSAWALAEEHPGEVNTQLSRRLKVPEGEHYTQLEAPWGIASCLLVSRGGQTPWRVALRTPSLANLSALGPALVGVKVTQIPDVVAGLGYTIGDAEK